MKPPVPFGAGGFVVPTPPAEIEVVYAFRRFSVHNLDFGGGSGEYGSELSAIAQDRQCLANRLDEPGVDVDRQQARRRVEFAQNLADG